MKEEHSKDLICLHGDNHGSWDLLFSKLDYLGINNCLLIGVGDAGVGFTTAKKQKRHFELLNNSFKKRGIKYITIRGNHDDPSYFDGSVKMSNFELLPDYTYREINGQVFLFVGGAVSIDRYYRKEGFSYWRDETFVLKKELIKECHTLITHSPPSWLGSSTKRGLETWTSRDPTLWDECLKERRGISELVKLSQAKFSYHGHMHTTAWANYEGCYSIILNIDEIIQYRHN